MLSLPRTLPDCLEMLQSSLKRAARTHRTVCAAPQRTLWRCSTLISSSPTSLLSHLEEAQTADADSTLTAYALSKNTPQELVPRFVAVLSSSSSSSPSIGCLSEVVPPSTLARLAPSAPLKGELYTVAIARHRPSSPTSSERAIPFRSTLTGRPNIALGREIKPEMRHDGEDAGFEAFLRGEKWGFGERANEGRAVSEGIDELKHVECVFFPVRGSRRNIETDFVDRRNSPADVKELVAFTADRMQPFLAALSTYPSAATVRPPSPTEPRAPGHHALTLRERTDRPRRHLDALPFSHRRALLALLRQRGRIERRDRRRSRRVPLCTCHQARLRRAGARRRALRGDEVRACPPLFLAHETSPSDLEPHTRAIRTRSSQGNIVLSLSNQNAARLLLDAVNKLFGTSAERLGAVQRSEEKDKEFFAALYDEQPSVRLALSSALCLLRCQD